MVLVTNAFVYSDWKNLLHIIHSGSQEQIKKVKFVNSSADFFYYIVLYWLLKKSLSNTGWDGLDMSNEDRQRHQCIVVS